MEITSNKADKILIDDKNWPDKITSFENKGQLTIVNNSDEIKLLELEKDLVIQNSGLVSITGKLIQLGVSTGEKAQTFDLPIPGYNIGFLWVETEEKSNTFEMYRCINLGGLDVKFSNVANDSLVGKVFRIEDGKIKFSDADNGAVIPPKNARIMIPNIIISTTGGNAGSDTASFDEDLGGTFIFRNVLFSDVKPSIQGAKKLVLQNVGVNKNLILRYINTLDINGLGVANDSAYASGVIITYCSEMNINNIVGQSLKSYGIAIQYVNNPVIKNMVGITLTRDSNTDSAVYLDTTSNAVLENITNMGARLYLNNINTSKITNITSVDTLMLNNKNSSTEANIYINNSSDLTIKNVAIPNGGMAYSGPMEINNSNKIIVDGINSTDANAAHAISLAVVFKSKIANINLPSVKEETTPIRLDNKSGDITLQNINIGNKSQIFLGGHNVEIKGLTASDILYINGSTESMFNQLYHEDRTGSITFVPMITDNVKVESGEARLLYSTGIDLIKGDVVEFESPFTFKGVTFNGKPNVIGGDEKLRIFFKVITSNKETDYMILNEDNLNSINSIIANNSFNLVIKLDASFIDEGTRINLAKINIPTKDMRFIYPVFLKKIRLNFNKLITGLPSAKYALVYAKNYESGKGVFVKDANGKDIVGKVNGEPYKEFDYDFEYDNTDGRVPNKDFDVVCVCLDKEFIKPIEIKQTITKEDDVSVSFVGEPDKATQIYREILKGQA